MMFSKKNLWLCLLVFTAVLLPDNAISKPKDDIVVDKKRIEEVMTKGLDLLASYASDKKKKSWFKYKFSTSLVGMAWLLSGSTSETGPYSKDISKITEQFLNEDILFAEDRKNKKGMFGTSFFSNWDYGFMLMYLSLYASKDDKISVEKKANEIISAFQSAQFPCGGWSHGNMFKNDLGYDHLFAATSIALTGLTMAKQAGFKVPQQMLDKGLGYINQCSRGGSNVWYANTHGGGECAGRTCAAYTILMRAGLDHSNELVKRLMPNVNHVDKIMLGHGDDMYHYFFVGLTSQYLKGDMWSKFYKDHLIRILDIQKEDGSIPMIPNLKQKNFRPGGLKGELGTIFDTALNCIILAFTLDTDNMLFDFSKEFTLIKSENYLKTFIDYLGDETPQSLKKFESLVSKVPFDKKRPDTINKLFKENFVKICADLNLISNKEKSSYVIEHLLNIELKESFVYDKKNVLTHCSFELNKSMKGNLKGILFYSFDPDIIKPVRQSTFSLYDSKPFKKKIQLKQENKKEEPQSFHMNVKIEIDFGEFKYTLNKKILVPTVNK